MVRSLPALQETRVQALDQEDPLEKERAISLQYFLPSISNHTHSSTLAWEIPWTEEPGGLQSRGSQRTGHDQEANTLCFHGKMKGVGVHKTKINTKTRVKSITQISVLD